MNGYIEMSDTWLLNIGATVDIEAPKDSPATNDDNNGGLRVLKTVNVKELAITPLFEVLMMGRDGLFSF